MHFFLFLIIAEFDACMLGDAIAVENMETDSRFFCAGDETRPD